MANPELLTGLGAALAVFLCNAGAAVASVPSGLFATRSTMKAYAFVPIIISGVLAIYGTIIGVILCGKFSEGSIEEKDGYRYLSAGLAVGLGCLASGIGMARFVGENLPVSRRISPSSGSNGEDVPLLEVPSTRSGSNSIARLFMVLVFIEALGLYGLIVALMLSH